MDMVYTMPKLSKNCEKMLLVRTGHPQVPHNPTQTMPRSPEGVWHNDVRQSLEILLDGSVRFWKGQVGGAL